MYNLKTQKVIINRDVTCDENEIWDWIGKAKELLTILVPINNDGELSSHLNAEE